MELDAIGGSALFRGLSERELGEALKALGAGAREFEKDALILRAGEATERMGLVLAGSVTVESCDLWGNRTILSHVGPAGIFAESYALLSDTPLLVDVRANEVCRILFLRPGGREDDEGTWRRKLSANLLRISAGKNLHLSERSFHTAPKTIRARVMAYLSSVSLRRHSDAFEIPFDRQQLADYLNVERTALSKELGKMQQDGLIRVDRRRFVLVRGQSCRRSDDEGARRSSIKPDP